MRFSNILRAIKRVSFLAEIASTPHVASQPPVQQHFVQCDVPWGPVRALCTTTSPDPVQLVLSGVGWAEGCHIQKISNETFTGAR